MGVLGDLGTLWQARAVKEDAGEDALTRRSGIVFLNITTMVHALCCMHRSRWQVHGALEAPGHMWCYLLGSYISRWDTSNVAAACQDSVSHRNTATGTCGVSGGNQL